MADAGVQHKHITILDEIGNVDQHEIEVWWDKGEQVIWKTSLAAGFKVVFDGPEGSPFDTDTFEVPAGGLIQSGVAKRGGRFKYTVHGPGGCNDPFITFHPP